MKNLLLVIFAITFYSGVGFADQSYWDSTLSKQGWAKTGRYYECHGTNGASNESEYLAVYEVSSSSNKIGFYSYATEGRYDKRESLFNPDVTGSIKKQGEALTLENRSAGIYISLSRNSASYQMPSAQHTGGTEYMVYYRCVGHGISQPGPF